MGSGGTRSFGHTRYRTRRRRKRDELGLAESHCVVVVELMTKKYVGEGGKNEGTIRIY